MSTKPAGLSRYTTTWAAPLFLAAVGCVGAVPTNPIGPGTGGGSSTGTGGGGTNPGGTGGGGTGSATGTGGAGALPGSGGVGPGTGGGSAQCSPLTPVPRRVWRLSNLQYSNSMRDMLKLTSGPEITGGGTAIYAFFSKDTEQVDSRLAFSYYQAAESVVAALDPVKLAACTVGEAEQACAQRLATSLATTGYRRPVSATEVTDLMLLYTEGRKKDFATGIRLMVEGILIAPSFAYRFELGSGTAGPATLTSYEVASQLSYLFLNSLPDNALVIAATANKLSTVADITAQVDRLLALPQAQANVARIVVDWVGAREVAGQKSATAFPPYNEALAQDLATSTRLFVEDVLWKGTKRLEDLVLSNKVFVSPRMAPVYGFTVPSGTAATAFVAVTAPDGQRAGILTQPGMLALKSNADETSIVKRGRFISDDILCGPPFPDPPLELLNQPDVMAALASFKTEAERTNYRMVTNAACKSCHLRMDPYGVLLENIDGIGRYRTKMADGSDVKATWDLAVSPSLTGSFTGPVEFAKGMVKDTIFSKCATRQMASYALGVDQPMTCELNGIHDRFQASADHSIATLLREITVASFMRTRGAQ